jgi:hypothetical protein
MDPLSGLIAVLIVAAVHVGSALLLLWIADLEIRREE